MLPRLILHIGGGKTGSSFLQHCFAVHSANLKALGVIYPEADSRSAAIAGAATSGNAVPLAVFLQSELGKGDPDTLRSLRATLDAAGGLDVLFSCEGMQAFKPQNLESVRELAATRGYELQVAYYVRSAVGRAYSAYVQRVKKHRERRDFQTFLRHYLYPCGRVASNLAGVLPPSNYLILNYDYARNDLFRHFARAALPPGATEIRIEPRVVNRTLNPFEIDFMLQINALLDSEPQSAFVGRALMESHSETGPIVVTPTEFDIIAAATTKDIELLNRYLPASEQASILGHNETVGARASSSMTAMEAALIAVLASVVRGTVRGRVSN